MLAFQAIAFGASSAADSMKTSKGTSSTTGPGRPDTMVFQACRTASGTISPRVASAAVTWDDLAWLRAETALPLVLKGILDPEDARLACEQGIAAIVVSNHGGRQLDGSRSPFDQLAEIVDAVGDRIDVICDGGVRRGTHVLKALSVGAKACSGGRFYLYALAAAGQAGVERALGNLRVEIERDMKLMGCRSIDQLSRDNLRFR